MTQPDMTVSRLRLQAQILEELAHTATVMQELTSSHNEYEAACVRALRGAGATWRDVGEALRTTRQAAWERFARLEGMGGQE